MSKKGSRIKQNETIRTFILSLFCRRIAGPGAGAGKKVAAAPGSREGTGQVSSSRITDGLLQELSTVHERDLEEPNRRFAITRPGGTSVRHEATAAITGVWNPALESPRESRVNVSRRLWRHWKTQQSSKSEETVASTLLIVTKVRDDFDAV